LVVIAIIAVLASLIAAAAVNALKNSKRARISLEIKNISASIEEFKTNYGAYPPNGMNPGQASPSAPPGTIGALVKSDFARMFKKAFPRSQEPSDVIDALAGVPLQSTNIVTTGPVKDGLAASEALYFWLGGFSADEQYPISGDGGPSFTDATGNNNGTLEAGDEVLEARKRLYEFDLTRLVPRDSSGAYGGDRLVKYKDPRNSNIMRQINLWAYTPSGSTKPLVYFDASRYKPGNNTQTSGTGKYDLWATRPGTEGGPSADSWIVAFKQLRSGVSVPSSANDFVFVNQGKFQVLHAGLDDDWGSEAFMAMSLTKNNNSISIVYPTGPFIGAIADTLTNFTDGTLADSAKQ